MIYTIGGGMLECLSHAHLKWVEKWFFNDVMYASLCSNFLLVHTIHIHILSKILPKLIRHNRPIKGISNIN